MKKRHLNHLVQLADHLDKKDLNREADVIDNFLKLSQVLMTIGPWRTLLNFARESLKKIKPITDLDKAQRVILDGLDKFDLSESSKSFIGGKVLVKKDKDSLVKMLSDIVRSYEPYEALD